MFQLTCKYKIEHIIRSLTMKLKKQNNVLRNVRIKCTKCGFEYTVGDIPQHNIKRLKKGQCLCGGKIEILWVI